MTPFQIIALKVTFYLLGLAGVFAHVVSNFISTSSQEGKDPTWANFRAYFSKRGMTTVLSSILFSFLYIIWGAMSRWGSAEGFAKYAVPWYGCFSPLVGWLADSLWKNATGAVQAVANKKLNGNGPQDTQPPLPPPPPPPTDDQPPLPPPPPPKG